MDLPNTKYITQEDTLDCIRLMCATFGGKQTFGFGPEDIGNHSIRTGSAMSLFLCKHQTMRILLLGRWRSDSVLNYIRTQVIEMTTNLSKDMIKNFSFTDLGATDLEELICQLTPRNYTCKEYSRLDLTISPLHLGWQGLENW